jgi:ABC-2 type transport system ATP-binding protein
MLQVENLTKYYGSYIGIEDVSFSMEAGEVVGFLGPNGAGKTTTMRILTCSMPATRGVARVAGRDVLQDSLAVRRQVGYLPETPPVYPEMTVESYLRFAATIKGVSRSDMPARLSHVLGVCGLEHVRTRTAGHLSKGYRQRVGIAQALIHDPTVLIFDEPTSGLDPGQIIEIRELLRELGEDKTVILSTHILAEAQMSCRRLLVINRGAIVGDIALDSSGEVASVTTPGGDSVTYSVTRSVNVVVSGASAGAEAAIRAVEGVQEVVMAGANGALTLTVTTPADTDLRPRIAEAALASGADLLELREARPSLERLFLDLTQTESTAEAGA